MVELREDIVFFPPVSFPYEECPLKVKDSFTNRVKFLQLLGQPLRPAAAAEGLIAIRNDRGPVQAVIPPRPSSSLIAPVFAVST